MKLHLPHRLRAAVLACCSAFAFTLASGSALLPSTAKEIAYEPTGDIPDVTWNSSSIGQYAFSTGDDVSFYVPATATLASNIQAGVINLRNHAELILIGGGHTLSASSGIDMGMGSMLTLNTTNTLATGTLLTGSSGALVRVDWGNTASSLDANLSKYKGALSVRNSTLSTTPTTASNYDRVIMEGASTLQLGDNTILASPITMEGDHTIQVATGNASLLGEISGWGTIHKTGTGTLFLGGNDEVHSGELSIEAGTVQWGANVASGSKQYQDNTLAFSKITVNSGATFEDSHMGINVSGTTDVVLKGGTMMAYDMQNPGSRYVGLLENVYKSLTVEGSGTLDFQFKGARQFLELTGSGTLTINNGTERTHTRFALVKDFNGTINGETKNDNNRLIIDRVELSEGITLNINQNLSPDTITKTGAGQLSVTGNIAAENDIILLGGPMAVSGATTATSVSIQNGSSYSNTGNVTTRGSFSVLGTDTSADITGTLTAGSMDTTGSKARTNVVGIDIALLGLDSSRMGISPVMANLAPALLMSGKSLLVTGNASVTGSIYITAGTTRMNSNLTANVYGGRYASHLTVSGAETELRVGAALQTGSIDMSGKTLAVTGALTVSRNASFTAGSTTAASASIGDALTLKGNSSLKLNGALEASAVSVGGSADLQVGAALTAELLSMTGGNTRVNGSTTVDTLDLAGSSFSTQGLTVHKMLTMDYTGEVDYTSISLGKDEPFNKDIVLSYVSGRENTINLSAQELAGMEVIYVDVSRVSAADLAKGIDLGITKSAKEKLSIAQLANYTLDDSGETLVLKAESKTPVLQWDTNWGTIELASAPTEIMSQSWAIIAEKEGLYGAQYYDNNSYMIAANATTGSVTGDAQRSHLLFGGAYGTQPVDAEGGNIMRDIWLNIAGGSFTMVTGGSLCAGSNEDAIPGSVYPWNIIGDTHIQVTKDIQTIGSVIGSNFLSGNNPTHTGDSYISVYSPKLTGSVVGSAYGAANTKYYGDSAGRGGTVVQTGNTYVFIYHSLSQNVATQVVDRTLTEVSEGLLTLTIDDNAVVGGSAEVGTATLNGDSNVTFDFSQPDAVVGNTVKSAVAGHWNAGTAQQTGDQNLTFIHMKGGSFNGTIYAAGHHNSGGAAAQSHTGNANLIIQDVHNVSFAAPVSGGHSIANGTSGSQSRIGDSLVSITDSTSVTFSGAVSGDHLWNTGTGANANQQHEGNTTLLVQDTDSIRFNGTVTAGSYWLGSDHPNTPATSFTQTNTGNTLLLVNRAPATRFNGDVVNGGSYAYLADEMTGTMTQTNTGKIDLVFMDSDRMSATANVIGGHYVYDAIDEPANPNRTPRTTIVQTQNGSIQLSIANSKSVSFSGDIVTGHYATGADDDEQPVTSLNVTQNQTGDNRLTITGVGSSSFSGSWLVGGHYNDDHVQNNVTQTHTTGSIYVTIDSGKFSNFVVGGDVQNYDAMQQTWTSTVTGDINFKLSNATFSNEVLGGSYNVGGTRATSVNDINFDIEKCTLSNSVSLVGGNDITGGGNSAIRDITINLKDSDVRGSIYGGTWFKGTGSLGVTQGNISIRINGGTIAGDIYAAGRQDGGGTMVTSSTRVELADNVKLNRNTISGGYLGGPDQNSGSIVTGDRTLAFTSATSAYQNINSVTFIYFDTVEVTEASTLVTLNENLQLLDNSVTKTGKGTLDLFHTNDIDTLILREGRVRLAANSAATSMFEHVHVEKGAILDISKGNSGVNGIVTMADASTLAVSINQYAPTVTNVDWQGNVNIQVVDFTSSMAGEDYMIPLFKADASHGLYQSDITGLTLGVISGIDGLATRAEGYVTSVTAGFETADAYLLLKDNTLYLTNMVAPARYWLGPSGTWNDTDKNWSRSELDTTDKTLYERGARTYFIAQDATPVDVTLGKDEEASSVIVRDGEFHFIKGNGSTITLYRDLVVQNGSADFQTEVAFSSISNINVGEGSTLTMEGNKNVKVRNLNNAGTVDLGETPLSVSGALVNTGTVTAGNVYLANGTAQGGTLLAKNVQLGGDTTFTQLNAANVSGNTGRTLTVNGAGESSIATLDGGTLQVDNGSLAIAQSGTTALTALKGNGTVTTPGTISMAQASNIGTLTAAGIVAGNTVDVAKTLATDTVTLQYATLGRPTVTAQGISSATAGAAVNVLAQPAIFTYLYPLEGKEYYLVQSSAPTASPLTVNGDPVQQKLQANRYEYTLSVVKDGVTMSGKITNYHYYRDNATTENGRAGADMLDQAFTDPAFEKMQVNEPNHKVLEIMHKIDELIAKGDKGTMDRLAAATAGSSIAPMSLAFNNDIMRHMRGIRNRTTCMGVAPCEVHTGMPYVNGWVNAEGNYTKLADDNTFSGYDLSSWGGTVGVDVDFTPALTAGIAISAMSGNYKASSSADELDGDMNSIHASLFARYSRKAWTHTFVASLATADISADRSVNVGGISYNTKGDTSGMGFGLMYELGYTHAINNHTAIQPMLNLSFVHAGVDGYTESGSGAALKVDDMSCNTFTVGAGARIQTATAADAFDRATLLEGRALVKVMAGDTQSDASVALGALPRNKCTVKSNDGGNIGLELGGGVSVPVGVQSSFIFADLTAEIRSGYTNINGTVGYRINF